MRKPCELSSQLPEKEGLKVLMIPPGGLGDVQCHTMFKLCHGFVSVSSVAINVV